MKAQQNRTSIINLDNPTGYQIDADLLVEFERGLNPQSPTSSKIPCRVLGYGEISTVFEIQVGNLQGLACKRMCVFETQGELDSYTATFREYNRVLVQEVGIKLPPQGYLSFLNEVNRPIFYIIQEQISSGSIGNELIHTLPNDSVNELFEDCLIELLKVWRYNEQHENMQVGFDGQISNWAIEGFDVSNNTLGGSSNLLYMDTSTPLMRVNGVEQLDAELFLRSAPSFLVWILRWLFLEDVVTRYYDPRVVIVDLIANFYKEGKAEFIPQLMDRCNQFINTRAADLNIQPITEDEVRSYYREDALIWSLYLSMRKIDQFIRTRTGGSYPYILPGKITR